MLNAGQAVFSGNYRPVETLQGGTPSRVITGGVMNVGELSPGEYTLEVWVRDKLVKKEGRALMRKEIDFNIE